MVRGLVGTALDTATRSLSSASTTVAPRSPSRGSCAPSSHQTVPTPIEVIGPYVLKWDEDSARSGRIPLLSCAPLRSNAKSRWLPKHTNPQRNPDVTPTPCRVSLET